MRAKLLATLLVLTCIFSHKMSVKAMEYPEPYKIRCTVYTAPEGAVTADGSKVREGIIAGKREWLGYTAIIYTLDYELIGIYEFKDTGGSKSLKNGTSVDVFCKDLDACKDWIKTYGDYVLIQVIYAEG